MTGKWIFLTKKLPTPISPPKFSMHYASEWQEDNARINQAEILAEDAKSREQWGSRYDDRLLDLGDRYIDTEAPFRGYEPKEDGALSILYMDTQIKVYPHEYTVVSPENMQIYIFGYPDENMPSHDLVPRADIDTLLLDTAEDTDLKSVREAALVDGCTEQQALAVLIGYDFEDIDAMFPPVGWYRCKHEYALIYCDEWELEE